jgi:hypothetical protein
VASINKKQLFRLLRQSTARQANSFTEMRLKFLISEFKKTWLVTSIGFVLLVVGSTILSVNEGKRSEKL